MSRFDSSYEMLPVPREMCPSHTEQLEEPPNGGVPLQNQEITPEDTPADNHDEFDRLSGNLASAFWRQDYFPTDNSSMKKKT